jgi:nicotinate-nucleotide adenylyltransferase
MAERAIVDLELEKVIFVPAGAPWMKANMKITIALHRINMLRLDLSNNPLFEISSLETNRCGPSYTIDTIKLLREEYGEQTQLYFLMGSDALDSFANWNNPRKVLDLSYLVVFTRSVHENIANILLNPVFAKSKDKIIENNSVNIAISSSDIRGMIRNNRSLEGKVPDKVIEYIVEARLYIDE